MFTINKRFNASLCTIDIIFVDCSGSLEPNERKQATAEIVAVLASLSQSFSEQSLGIQQLDASDKQIFAAIPPSIISLNLSENQLGNKSADELVRIIQALPLSITSLNLDTNKLGAKTADELISIIQAIPSSITLLKIRGTELGLKATGEIIRILKALPPTVTELDLGRNELQNKSTDELVQILQTLPQTITSLSLSHTLNDKSLEDIIRIVQAIPSTISSVNLSRNGLDMKNEKEFAEILKSIPPSITSIKLSFYYIKVNCLQTLQILSTIPDTVQTIDVNWEIQFTKSTIRAMTPEQRQHSKGILTKTPITIVDNSFHKIGRIPRCNLEAQNFYFSRICRTDESPTLKASAAFFVAQKMKDCSTEDLDEHCKEFLMNFSSPIHSA